MTLSCFLYTPMLTNHLPFVPYTSDAILARCYRFRPGTHLCLLYFLLGDLSVSRLRIIRTEGWVWHTSFQLPSRLCVLQSPNCLLKCLQPTLSFHPFSPPLLETPGTANPIAFGLCGKIRFSDVSFLTVLFSQMFQCWTTFKSP